MSSDTSQKYTQQWVRYQVHSHSILQEIQKQLGPYVSDRYTQINPTDYHVTLVPQFTCLQNDLPSYHSYVFDSFPYETPITATEAYFYPSRTEPRVICLNVETPDFDLISKRDTLVRKIEKDQDSEKILDPVNPHITLFTIDDPMDSSMSLPPQISQLHDTVDEINKTYLPFTFDETELKLSSISNPG